MVTGLLVLLALVAVAVGIGAIGARLLGHASLSAALCTIAAAAAAGWALLALASPPPFEAVGGGGAPSAAKGDAHAGAEGRRVREFLAELNVDRVM